MCLLDLQCMASGHYVLHIELRQVVALAGWDRTVLHEALTDQI